MFDRILVPVGLGEPSKTLVDAVAALGAGGKTGVALLHVIQTVENIEAGELEDFYGSLEEKAGAYLKELEAAFGERGIGTRSAIVYGNRVEEILAYARAEAAQLILMTSHKVEATAPARGWNSISHTIAIFSPCPVLLLK